MIPELWVIAFKAGMEHRFGLKPDDYAKDIDPREIASFATAYPDSVNPALEFYGNKFGLNRIDKEQA
jgi:hypothetical protein